MKKTIEQRFHEKYKIDPVSGCWIWIMADGPGGYGCMRTDGKSEQAHRLSYRLKFGCIPDGFWVLHRCDVRKCVNPKHLFLGTVQDNNKDRENKKRGVYFKGQDQPGSKLTEDDVLSIRARYIPRRRRHQNGSLQSLASEFGVTKTLIHLVVSRKNWRHI